jgi:hypothetical protein
VVYALGQANFLHFSPEFQRADVTAKNPLVWYLKAGSISALPFRAGLRQRREDRRAAASCLRPLT